LFLWTWGGWRSPCSRKVLEMQGLQVKSYEQRG